MDRRTPLELEQAGKRKGYFKKFVLPGSIVMVAGVIILILFASGVIYGKTDASSISVRSNGQYKDYASSDTVVITGEIIDVQDPYNPATEFTPGIKDYSMVDGSLFKYTVGKDGIIVFSEDSLGKTGDSVYISCKVATLRTTADGKDRDYLVFQDERSALNIGTILGIILAGLGGIILMVGIVLIRKSKKEETAPPEIVYEQGAAAPMGLQSAPEVKMDARPRHQAPPPMPTQGPMPGPYPQQGQPMRGPGPMPPHGPMPGPYPQQGQPMQRPPVQPGPYPHQGQAPPQRR